MSILRRKASCNLTSVVISLPSLATALLSTLASALASALVSALGVHLFSALPYAHALCLIVTALAALVALAVRPSFSIPTAVAAPSPRDSIGCTDSGEQGTLQLQC